MLNFVAKHFRTFINITLWINLVFWAIFLGFMLGETHRSIFNDRTSREFSAGGCFLGLVIGILTDIIFGGLIAVFLSIDKGVKNMNKWLQSIWQNSNSIKTDAKTKPINDDDIYYFDSQDNSSSNNSASEDSDSGSFLS